jgi:hypothetical protein
MDGDLTLKADHQGDTTTTVGATAAGDKAAVGVSLAANVAIDLAEASIHRDATLDSGNVLIEASTLSNSSASAKASASGGEQGSSSKPAEIADSKITKETDSATKLVRQSQGSGGQEQGRER